MISERFRKRKLWSKRIVFAALITALACASWFKIAAAWHQSYTIRQPEYASQFGRWDEIDIPKNLRINTVHQALLPTGKVLLIAGSGNNQDMFDAGTFKTLLYDPVKGDTKLVDTPIDMFCAGHAFLPDGNLLIAGGTQQYQTQPPDRTNTGGIVTIFNETPTKDKTFKKGTIFTSQDGKQTYKSDNEVYLPPAEIDSNTSIVTASQRNVWVDSTDPDDRATYKDQKLIVQGLNGEDAQNFHGYAPMFDVETKKDYQGTRQTYEFNPWQERYEAVQPMKYARWYPTLIAMTDGHVMAISGLDNAGKVLDGQIEIYDPASKTWGERKDLKRFFPTYPAIFQTDVSNKLFFAGSTTGWGPVEEGRKEGFWNLENNSFSEVGGLRDPDLIETSSASWYGFVGNQKVVVIGGGGVGDSPKSTGRIDVVDLKAATPRFSAIASLEDGTRYPNTVVLPDGRLFITGGSREYRGNHSSNILKSYMLDPETNSLKRMADPLVGRNYHATALLLPNGQILVAGSDPLFGDEKDTKPGTFEQRIEVYSPPYMFTKTGENTQAPKVIKSSDTSISPNMVARGGTYAFKIESSRKLSRITLVHPGAVTHATDTNARVLNLAYTASGQDTYQVSVPENPSLTPPGYYMLHAIDEAGYVSTGYWVHLDGSVDASMSMAGMNPMVDTDKSVAEPVDHSMH
ncbi:DUF1929 domain-containing protein [Candidatus Saccharibacteria bacterium]|nr:DUF1929 domain-containing protein [Candidatus Saccharibacteria bacterium]